MSEATTVSPVELTEAAAAEVKRLIETQDLPEGTGLRIAVQGGGCSGLQYGLNFEAQEQQGDKTFETQEIKLFVDAKSALYLAGVTVDFTSGLEGTGFVFNNPNAEGTCGCGSSFSC